MALIARLSSLVIARLGPAFQSLQALLRRWTPQPSPVLVPIPIAVDRRARDAAERRSLRGF